MTVHRLIDTCLDIAREHGRRNARSGEYPASLVDFMIAVPCSDHEMKARPASRLDETNYCTQS